MCVFAEQSSAYDIVGVMDGVCGGGKARHRAWSGFLSLLPHQRCQQGHSRRLVGREFTPQASRLGIALGSSLAVCTCLMLPVTPYIEWKQAPPINVE